jgi:hypothetical protein
MARVPCVIRSTPIADRQIAALRGPRRAAYDEFERALAHHGCRALTYRLTGGQPLPSLCVKHLRGKDRVVVGFASGEAWVLLVGPHDAGDAAADVYTRLYELAGVPPPTQPRSKPPCCGDSARPPDLDEPVIDDLVRRARTRGR